MQNNSFGAENIELPKEHEELVQKVGKMIDTIDYQNILTCDAECEKNKLERSLYENYNKAKTNLENAPKQLDQAERNYLTFSLGGLEYQEQKEEEMSQEAESLVLELTTLFEEKKRKIYDLIGYYNSQLNSEEYGRTLANDYTKKANQNMDNLENEKSKNNVADRISYYNIEWFNYWKSFHSYMAYIFLLLSIVFLSIMIVYKKYTTKLFTVGFCILVIAWYVPFLLFKI